MANEMKPTKKNSPAIHRGANRDNKPAADYAPPHKMSGKELTADDIGLPVRMPTRENWTPLNGQVSIGQNNQVNMNGEITMRGHGAAERGIKSRGPMA
jgi:hypothetical protein